MLAFWNRPLQAPMGPARMGEATAPSRGAGTTQAGSPGRRAASVLPSVWRARPQARLRGPYIPPKEDGLCQALEAPRRVPGQDPTAGGVRTGVQAQHLPQDPPAWSGGDTGGEGAACRRQGLGGQQGHRSGAVTPPRGGAAGAGRESEGLATPTADPEGSRGAPETHRRADIPVESLHGHEGG